MIHDKALYKSTDILLLYFTSKVPLTTYTSDSGIHAPITDITAKVKNLTYTSYQTATL